MDTTASKLSLNQCLIGCQSVECAPKTCCSTNELDVIVINKDASPQEINTKKSQNRNKSNSLMSLNVSSLTKCRKITGSASDMGRRCTSESHVEQSGASSTLNMSQTINNIVNDNPDKVTIQETDGRSTLHTDDTEEKKLLTKYLPPSRADE